ncbi:hypothetical protein RUM43_011699, partial [Polyplax serrata]
GKLGVTKKVTNETELYDTVDEVIVNIHEYKRKMQCLNLRRQRERERGSPLKAEGKVEICGL